MVRVAGRRGLGVGVGVMLGYVLLVGATSRACAQDACAAADSLEDALETSVGRADFAAAVDVADRWLDSLRACGAPMYEIRGGEALRSGWRQVAGRPDSVRLAVARSCERLRAAQDPYAAGRYAEALPLRQEAARIVDGLLPETHPHQIRVLMRLGAALIQMGRSADAEGPLRRALAGARETYGDHPIVAECHNDLAQSIERQGRLREAEGHYRRALELDRRLLGADHEYVFYDINNLAHLLHKLGDYAQADALHRDLLRRSPALFPDDLRMQSLLIVNYAHFLRAHGDWIGAESFYRRGLLMREEAYGPSHPLVAETLNNIGVLLRDRRAYAEAETEMRRALGILTQLYAEDHPRTALALNNIAEVLMKQERYAEAESLLIEAVAMARRLYGEDHRETSHYLHNLGSLHRRTQRYGEAARFFEHVLRIREKVLGPNHRETAEASIALGALEARRGGRERATAMLQRGLNVLETALGGSHASLAEPLLELGRLRKHEGDLERAAAHFQRAAGILEISQQRTVPDLHSGRFLSEAYPALAAVLLELGRGQEAWDALERGLARGLAAVLHASVSASLPATERAREDSLRRELSKLEQRQSALAEAGSEPIDEGRAEDVRRVRRENKQRMDAIQADLIELLRNRLSHGRIDVGGCYDLAQVQAALAPDEAILGLLEDTATLDGSVARLWGYVMRHRGHVHWVPLATGQDASSWQQECDRLRGLLSDVPDPFFGLEETAGATRFLETRLLAPLSPHLGDVNHLIVVPSGSLLGIPLEVAAGAEGPLARWAISYTPSASIQVWLRRQDVTRTDRDPEAPFALLVGDPPYAAGGTWHRLPGSREEVLLVASMLADRAQVLLGPAASESAMVALAPRADEFLLMHFATHTQIDRTHPDQSRFILAQGGLPSPFEVLAGGGRIMDGCWSAKEVAVEWELTADLVFASSCESGLGPRLTGEGHVGFAQAFFQAGAGAMIASLWTVDDEAAQRLIERFYHHLLTLHPALRSSSGPRRLAGHDIAVALRRAKQDIRTEEDPAGRSFAHPWYWAGFVLLGGR